MNAPERCDMLLIFDDRYILKTKIISYCAQLNAVVRVILPVTADTQCVTARNPTVRSGEQVSVLWDYWVKSRLFYL
jgi:hypothetical protein